VKRDIVLGLGTYTVAAFVVANLDTFLAFGDFIQKLRSKDPVRLGLKAFYSVMR